MINSYTGSVEGSLLKKSFSITEKTSEISQNPEKLKSFEFLTTIVDISIFIFLILIVSYFLKSSASKNNLEMSYGKAFIGTIYSIILSSILISALIIFGLNPIISFMIFFVLFFYILYFSLKGNFKIELKQSNRIATRTVGFLILFTIIFAILKSFLYLIILRII